MLQTINKIVLLASLSNQLMKMLMILEARIKNRYSR
jgi:hypothetical protein